MAAAAAAADGKKRVEGDYHEPEFIQIVVSDAKREKDYITYQITTNVRKLIFYFGVILFIKQYLLAGVRCMVSHTQNDFLFMGVNYSVLCHLFFT